MKFGLFGINFGACAESRRRSSRRADGGRRRFRIALDGRARGAPDPALSDPPPRSPDVLSLDPAVALAHVAAHTKTIRLGTGIIILPQRNPVILAKELTSVDVVSGGRLIFGLGVGYLKAEFDALGIPFEDKGARATDYLAAILALWTQDKPSHEGPLV